MSAFLLGTGFRADMGTCIRKLVLLKLIDACEEDGTRIFPAIATVAAAAQCSPRQVQREIRAFLDIGLLRLVREGGKGRRSTNEYALDLDVLTAISRDGWDAYATGVLKGDTVSPLDEDAKGDTDGVDRVTPEPSKGDNVCRTTPPDPSLDPSVEREARERANEACPEDDPTDGGVTRETWIKRLKRAHSAWPTFVADSAPAAEKAWFDLTPLERDAAAERAADYLTAAKVGGRTKPCSFGRYLAEKRWEKLPDKPTGADAAADAEPEPPFGRMWGALRLSVLVGAPIEALPRLTPFLQKLVDQGGEAGERERLAHLARHGWPIVNRMHAQAAQKRGEIVPARLKLLAETFDKVRVGGDLWRAWERLHAARGWPWLADASPPDWVYLPAVLADDDDQDRQVAAALTRFEAALASLNSEGKSDDMGAVRRAG